MSRSGKIVAMTATAVAIRMVVPSTEDVEPAWLRALQYWIGTRRYVPPGNMGMARFSRLRAAVSTFTARTVEPICRIDHPEGW